MVGSGTRQEDGSLILDQTISREGHAPEQRRWQIRHVASGGYAASLSSAAGPVAISVQGNLLQLDFRQGKMSVHQDILLAPDGQSAVNRMTLRRFGLRVAAIEERITRSRRQARFDPPR